MDKKSPLVRLSFLGCLGAAGLASTSAMAQSADAPAAPSTTEEVDEVIVTGFRASLQSSAAEKRENVNFTDSIFAEDIGKFPDLNLAESLQRVPGVQVTRDVTGEGASVAVRGLGRDFTLITLNGARIETASDMVSSAGIGRPPRLRGRAGGTYSVASIAYGRDRWPLS